MVMQQFRNLTFKVEALPGTMHPGFALSTFREEIEFREKYWDIKPGQTVIDAGAAYGSYTLPALMLGAEVYAFEPEPKIFPNLRYNVYINQFYQAHLYEYGLWDKVENIDIKTYAPHYATQLTSPTYNMMTLDSINKRVDWIKIDVEGAEEKVIMGALHTIQLSHPKLIIECHNFIDPNISENIKKLLPQYQFEEIPRDPCVILVSK